MHRIEGVLAAGAPWLVAAATSAEAGWLQMAEAGREGVICGLATGQAHCAACYAALALLGAGAMAMMSAWRGAAHVTPAGYSRAR